MKMVDQEAISRAEELMQKYEYNWGKKPELICIPRSVTQEKFVEVMEYIVETGESFLVGWNKCFLDDMHK